MIKTGDEIADQILKSNKPLGYKVWVDRDNELEFLKALYIKIKNTSCLISEFTEGDFNEELAFIKLRIKKLNEVNKDD